MLGTFCKDGLDDIAGTSCGKSNTYVLPMLISIQAPSGMLSLTRKPSAMKTLLGGETPNMKEALTTNLLRIGGSEESKNASHEVCCICLDSLLKEGIERQTLPCDHTLHEQCIPEMRRHGAMGRCPLCRESHAGFAQLLALLVS